MVQGVPKFNLKLNNIGTYEKSSFSPWLYRLSSMICLINIILFRNVVNILETACKIKASFYGWFMKSFFRATQRYVCIFYKKMATTWNFRSSTVYRWHNKKTLHKAFTTLQTWIVLQPDVNLTSKRVGSTGPVRIR